MKRNNHSSRFISQFERPDYLVYSFDEICYDDTKSATKIPASEYSKQGLYPIFDQATDSVIAGYTNDSNGINNDYPAVLFGDHSRVVKLIDRAFFIGADGVKVLRPVNAGLSTEFLYYQIKFKTIPNTGYNRHFKYLKDHSYCVPRKNEQDAFLAMCHQADKSKFSDFKSRFIEIYSNRKDYIRLGDLVIVRTGKLDANAADEKGKYPFFTCGSETLQINNYAFDCEAVLLAGNGEFCVKYYDGKFNAYQRTYIIESTDKERLLVPFLFSWMQQYAETLKQKAIGGVIKYIRLGDITEAPFILPSIKEQVEYISFIKQTDKSKYLN